jgi:CheY-like chemotaxis protein
VHQQSFDALISDIRMADIDGISMCRQIRSKPKLGNLLVIASSASVYEDDRHNAISSGFDDFVPKPVRETGRNPDRPFRGFDFWDSFADADGAPQW